MKSKVSISVILTLTLLIASIALSVPKRENISDTYNTTKSTDPIISEPHTEMRGLWISYISLDMSGTDRSFDSFKERFSNILDKAVEYKCNTLIVQVRPFSDALYESSLFPHSHILSGTQGVSPGYDALEYMCEASHGANLDIHVWINPYRVKLTQTPSTLANSSIYNTDPSLCIETDSGIYLNPCKQKARELIINGIREIVENYSIDGVHFDDYFYPQDLNNADKADYNAYIKSLETDTDSLSIEEWRKTNVNILIAEVYKAIKESNKNIVFGISPQGNLDNNSQIGADIESWCKYIGYADYICPQMYYSIDNPALKFEDCIKQWTSLTIHNELDIYIGLGVYKAGTDADDGTWQGKSNILATELNLLREYNFNGYILYEYNSMLIESSQTELSNLLSVI